MFMGDEGREARNSEFNMTVSEMSKKIDRAADDLNECKRELERLKSALDDDGGRWPSPRGDQVARVPSPHGIEFRKALKGHFQKVLSVSWNPRNNSQLVSASQDGSLIVWNAYRAIKNKIIKLTSSWVMSTSFSEEGSLIAAGGLDNLLYLYTTTQEIKDGPTKPYCAMPNHEGYISNVKFITDNEVVSCSGDSSCVLWDIATQVPKVVFAEHEGDVMSISVRDENTFFSGGVDKTARFWDCRAPRCVQVYNAHDLDVNGVQRFPNKHSFGTCSDDGKCKLFDIRCWGELRSFSRESGLTCLDFSKSGRILFLGTDEKSVVMFDTLTGEEIPGPLKQHENKVVALEVSPDGTALATASFDWSILVWA